MKKLLFTIAIGLVGMTAQAQTNFKWDEVDSISKTKTELYSLTKMYIAETWKSAQDVIQNDDKDGGMILVKGVSIQKPFYQMHTHNLVFSYSVKFLFKDNKYRIIIENVYCQSHRVEVYDWALMPVADTYPTEKGLRITTTNEEKYLEIMASLRNELQLIVDGYELYLKNNKGVTTNHDW